MELYNIFGIKYNLWNYIKSMEFYEFYVVVFLYDFSNYGVALNVLMNQNNLILTVIKHCEEVNGLTKTVLSKVKRNEKKYICLEKV
jgi:hypothetical protein